MHGKKCESRLAGPNMPTDDGMNIPRRTLTEAYADGGIRPPNILNEWTALDVERNVVTFQLDMKLPLLPQPTLGNAVEGAILYNPFTREDLVAWNRQCVEEGRALPNKQQGWRKLRFDFDYAMKHDSTLRFIHIQYRPDCANEQILQATFRKDWVGKVNYLNPNSGCYELAILASTPPRE